MKYYDSDFIDHAYLSILGREADKNGKNDFLSKLRSGALSKEDILLLLRNSQEGMDKNPQTYENKIKFIFFKLYKIPILGYILQALTILFTLPALMKKINTNESNMEEDLFLHDDKLNQLSSKVSYADLENIIEKLSFHIKYQAHTQEKKILICCNAYPPNFIGGAELIAHYQALELKKQGYTVKVFAGDFHIDVKHYDMYYDSYEGIGVHRVKVTPEDFDANGINFRHKEVEKHFQDLLDDFQPNIVHMHNIIGLSILLADIAKKQHIKTFLTLHDAWGFCYKNTIMKNDGASCHNYTECDQCMPLIHDDKHANIPLIMRKHYFMLALDKVDVFISPSKYLREQYIQAGFHPDKIVVLPNGIDVAKFDLAKIPSDKIRFTFIGNLGNHKGVLLILEALIYIEKKHKLHINIVGEGPLKEKIENYLVEHSLSEYVTLLGKVANHEVVRIFAETDVYIIPSMWPENQPVTITEAFASKVPVIGTDLGGIKELVIPNHSGLLFPMGDTKALAKNMQYFIKSPEKVSTFGQNAYNSIKEKTFSHQVKELSKHYHSTFSIPVVKKPFVISCIGEHISDEILEIIKLVNKQNKQIYFVLHTWLNNPFSCDTLWLMDDTLTIDEIIHYEYLQKPFLLTDTSPLYKSYCIQKNELSYNSIEHAVESILYLFEHQDMSMYRF